MGKFVFKFQVGNKLALNLLTPTRSHVTTLLNNIKEYISEFLFKHTLYLFLLT